MVHVSIFGQEVIYSLASRMYW